MSEPRGILSEDAHVSRPAQERAEKRKIASSRNMFDSYALNKWEHTYFNGNTGGFVVTDLARIPPESETNQSNEGKKYRKERSMCIDLADFGLGVKHLFEKAGVSSADIIVDRGKHAVVEINGKTADLKALNNSNNIRREAKDTFEKKKKADLIVFRFAKRDRKIENEIRKLARKNWHGMYYFRGENELHEF